jgi:hypothetical protein
MSQDTAMCAQNAGPYWMALTTRPSNRVMPNSRKNNPCSPLVSASTMGSAAAATTSWNPRLRSHRSRPVCTITTTSQATGTAAAPRWIAMISHQRTARTGLDPYSAKASDHTAAQIPTAASPGAPRARRCTMAYAASAPDTTADSRRGKKYGLVCQCMARGRAA